HTPVSTRCPYATLFRSRFTAPPEAVVAPLLRRPCQPGGTRARGRESAFSCLNLLRLSPGVATRAADEVNLMDVLIRPAIEIPCPVPEPAFAYARRTGHRPGSAGGSREYPPGNLSEVEENGRNALHG